MNAVSNTASTSVITVLVSIVIVIALLLIIYLIIIIPFLTLFNTKKAGMNSLSFIFSAIWTAFLTIVFVRYMSSYINTLLVSKNSNQGVIKKWAR
jgi:energy-coupling factor transporter transmembrane protein EcfT